MDRRCGTRGDGTEQQQRRFVPRPGFKAFAFEQREGHTYCGSEIFVATAAQGKEIPAIIGPIARDGAIFFEQCSEEIGRGDCLGTDCFGQGVVDGALDNLRPSQQLQQEAMVVRRVLAEAAVRADELGALLGERGHTRLIPFGRARQAGPAREGQGDGGEGGAMDVNLEN